MNAKAKTQKLYSGLGGISFFTAIRFWTGSLGELEALLPKQGKILDLGCGYGILANYLGLCSASREVIGIEIDKEKLKLADRGVANVSFIAGDIIKVKLPQVQAIVIADVLHHLSSYQEQELLIEKCYQLLAEKGVLLISDVDNYSLWKLILGRLTDFILYPGEKILYCYSDSMLALLNKYFLSDNIKMKRLKYNPYPHVVYQCQKN